MIFIKIPKIVKNIVNKVDEEINEVKDPICGMKVNLEKTKFKSTYEGKEYGFCSTGCKAEFDKNPYQHAEANC